MKVEIEVVDIANRWTVVKLYNGKRVMYLGDEVPDDCSSKVWVSWIFSEDGNLTEWFRDLSLLEDVDQGMVDIGHLVVKLLEAVGQQTYPATIETIFCTGRQLSLPDRKSVV